MRKWHTVFCADRCVGTGFESPAVFLLPCPFVLSSPHSDLFSSATAPCLRIAIVICGAAILPAGAADTSGELKQVHVVVTDQGAHPVEGALLTPLAVEKQGHALSPWDEERHGPAWKIRTDVSGQAHFSLSLRPDTAALGSVYVQIEANGYAPVRRLLVPSERKQHVLVARGRQIAVSASNDGERLEQNVYAVLAGFDGLTRWRLSPGGVLHSDVVSRKRDRLLIACLRDEGPILFSDVLKLGGNATRSSRVLLRNVPVRGGMKFSGQLSADVRRPVQDGYVCVYVTQHAGLGDAERRLSWRDVVPVESDGSFLVPSLPREGILQFYAWCDGWVSQPAAPRDLEPVGLAQFRGGFVEAQDGAIHLLPQILRLREQAKTCEIPMQETAVCELTVTSTAGTPVVGAQVDVPSLVYWLTGELEQMGDIPHTKRWLSALRDSGPLSRRFNEERMRETGSLRRLRRDGPVKTDEFGRATLTGLLGGSVDSPRQVPLRVRVQPPHSSTMTVSHNEELVSLIGGETTNAQVIVGSAD